MRTSQGVGGGLQPPESGNAIIFRANTKKFSGRSQQPKMKKILFLYRYLFIKRKNGIHSVQGDEVPEIRDFCYRY